MQLQLALDLLQMKEAKKLLKEIGDTIDIIEIGTPFVIKEGIKAVKEIKKEFPLFKVLADLKIMDAGEYEANIGFEAGADIITVLGAANDATIKGAVKQAKKYNKYVMVDMIAVKDLKKRAAEIDKLGVDYICVHTAFDVQAAGKNPLEELQKVKSVVKNAKMAVAGGIKLETLEYIIEEQPEIIIVGGGITGQADKRKTAIAIKEMINNGKEA